MSQRWQSKYSSSRRGFRVLTEPQTVPRLSNKVLAVQRQKDACDEMWRDLTEGHQLNSAEASRALEENDEEYCRQAVEKKIA